LKRYKVKKIKERGKGRKKWKLNGGKENKEG
jgi:hypothetical protein